jgi:hypothetical protein
MASPAREFFVVVKEAGKVNRGRCKYDAIIVRYKAQGLEWNSPGTACCVWLLGRHWWASPNRNARPNLGRYHVPSQKAAAPRSAHRAL